MIGLTFIFTLCTIVGLALRLAAYVWRRTHQRPEPNRTSEILFLPAGAKEPIKL